MGASTQQPVCDSGVAAVFPPPVGAQQGGYIPPHANATSADEIQFDRVFGDMPDLTWFSNGPEWSPVTFPADVMNPIPGLYSSSLLPWKDFSETGNNFMTPNSSTSYGVTRNDGNTSNGNSGTDSHQQPRDRIPPVSSILPVPRLQSTPAEPPSTGIDIALFDVTEHQRQLLLEFTPKANPIPLITPTDSQWKSAYSSLISMACGCTHLINAICAVSELNLSASKKGTVARAFNYYQSAATKAEGVLNLPSPQVDDRSLKQAFATLLLLMQAEVRCLLAIHTHTQTFF